MGKLPYAGHNNNDQEVMEKWKNNVAASCMATTTIRSRASADSTSVLQPDLDPARIHTVEKYVLFNNQE